MTKKEDVKQDKKLIGKMIKESDKKDIKRDKKMIEDKVKSLKGKKING